MQWRWRNRGKQGAEHKHLLGSILLEHRAEDLKKLCPLLED